MAGKYSKRKHKKFMKSQGYSGSDIEYVRSLPKRRKKPAAKRANSGSTGWMPAKAVKIVRNKKGGAAKLLIRGNPYGDQGGGAGSGAGAGSEGGKSRTEVRSPTSTVTSTKAKTTGNITVTGGAGAGANTTVTIAKKAADGRTNPAFPRQWVRAKAVRVLRNSKGQAVKVQIKT